MQLALLRRWYGFASFPVRDLRDALSDRVDGDVVQRDELGDRVLEPSPTHVYPRCQCLSQRPQIIVHASSHPRNVRSNLPQRPTLCNGG